MGAGTHYVPAGTAGDGAFSLVVTPESAGWGYSSLRLLALGAGESRTFDTGEDEVLVLPLNGACRVDVDGELFELAGRDSVFSGVTDFAYAPRKSTVTVTSDRGGRFALPAARATKRLPARYGPASGVPVELRGAGTCSRQVLTPGGNWSSYPPHKHDETKPGEEAELEEIYYFEVAGAPQGTPGVGYQRVYGTADRPLDVLEEVRTGDVVLIPHGWHGPSMAAPGYDLYYLNVMAGPGDERAWLICDDPAHAWVRGTWNDQPVDPRLPFYTSTGDTQ
jgi:5-deoxy-glucuronate isomerase